MDPQVLRIATYLIALVFSLTFHEFAHAYVAKWQGDDTAEQEGRLTLDPMAHIDPIGTIFLPLLMAITSAGIFGWAKPVPVDTQKLRNPKWGYVAVAAAGPASNLVFCFVSVLVLRIYSVHFSEALTAESFFYPIIGLIEAMAFINAILAVFNLIPLPPLDGATVFSAILPQAVAEGYERFVAPYGMFILIGLMLTGGLRFVFYLTEFYLGFSQFVVSAIV